jgi:hypothetical protein
MPAPVIATFFTASFFSRSFFAANAGDSVSDPRLPRIDLENSFDAVDRAPDLRQAPALRNRDSRAAAGLELRRIVEGDARSRVVDANGHAHEPFEAEHARDVVETLDPPQERIDVRDDVALAAELDAVDGRCSRPSATWAAAGPGPGSPPRSAW